MKKIISIIIFIHAAFMLFSKSVTVLDFENNTGDSQYSPIILNSQDAITMCVHSE